MEGNRVSRAKWAPRRPQYRQTPDLVHGRQRDNAVFACQLAGKWRLATWCYIPGMHNIMQRSNSTAPWWILKFAMFVQLKEQHDRYCRKNVEKSGSPRTIARIFHRHIHDQMIKFGACSRVSGNDLCECVLTLITSWNKKLKLVIFVNGIPNLHWKWIYRVRTKICALPVLRPSMFCSVYVVEWHTWIVRALSAGRILVELMMCLEGRKSFWALNFRAKHTFCMKYFLRFKSMWLDFSNFLPAWDAASPTLQSKNKNLKHICASDDDFFLVTR